MNLIGDKIASTATENSGSALSGSVQTHSTSSGAHVVRRLPQIEDDSRAEAPKLGNARLSKGCTIAHLRAHLTDLTGHDPCAKLPRGKNLLCLFGSAKGLKSPGVGIHLGRFKAG